jgi:hypothetical protein
MSNSANSLLSMLNPDYRPLHSITSLVVNSTASLEQANPNGLMQKLALSPQTQCSKQQAPSVRAERAMHRAGDWICLLCQNHNYSFRNICNRCKSQSKIDNMHQSLAYYQPSPLMTPFPYKPSFPLDQHSPKMFSNGSLQTIDLEQSDYLGPVAQTQVKPRPIKLSLPRSEIKDIDRADFPFERQLNFSSSEEESDEEGREEDQPSSASKRQEKRILDFLNFD